MHISDFSIKRPVFTFMTMCLVLLLGAVAFTRIPLKLLPDIEPPVAVVVTSYPGAGPEEVLEKVTIPLERNLSTLPGLKNMSSTSQEGANLILLEFNWDTDVDVVQANVLQRIEQTSLPDDAGKPRYLKFDPAQLPIIQLTLRTDGNEETLQDLATDLQQELAKLEGVANITVSGTAIEDVVVRLDQDKLHQFGLSQNDIVQVISANQISLPGQTVITGKKELTTRIISTIDSLEAIKDLVVTVNPVTGEEITVADVSNVQIEKRQQTSITRVNEQPAVMMSVLQKSEANTYEVSREFKRALDELLQEARFANVQADILFDQGDFIRIAIRNILQSLIIGGLLAIVILFFFLRGIKSPLMIAIAIPYSVIVTFVLMYVANFSINMMTLGGLALGVGMLIDNAIVVIENINRHLSLGKDPKEAASSGVKEVATAISASTFSTIVVFLPVIFVSGIVGDMMREFSLTIAFSLFASLVVALTVVPMLAAYWLKKPSQLTEEKRLNAPFYRLLERSVRWSLRHRPGVLLVLLLFIILSIFGFDKVGSEFFPEVDEGYLTIQVELENGTALTETERVIAAIEEDLQTEEAVEFYVSLIGATQRQITEGGATSNQGEVFVKLVPLAEREISVFEFVEDKQKDLENLLADINENAIVTTRLPSSVGIEANTLSFLVTGTNANHLEETVEKIVRELDGMEGITEVSTSLADTVEEVRIEVDKEKALAHGFAPGQIALLVNDMMRGVRATSIDNDDRIMDVIVTYDEAITTDLEKLEELVLRKHDGSYVSLGELVTIEIGHSPVAIQRTDMQRAISVDVKYATTYSLSEIVTGVDETVENLDLPEGIDIAYTGEQELFESTIADLILALVLAIVFVYMVLAAQFESFKYPFIIMFTVPLAIIGTSFGLVTTDTPVSVMAIIGMIVLAGIVVNNGIVLVDYMNRLQHYGYRGYDVIIQGVKVRFRPVLMTALTTIFALIPLALGFGEGAELNQPMAIVVIGGLISSTFLTLFIIPIIYSYLNRDIRKSLKEGKKRLPSTELLPPGR